MSPGGWGVGRGRGYCDKMETVFILFCTELNLQPSPFSLTANSVAFPLESCPSVILCGPCIWLRGYLPVFPCRAVVEAVHRLDLILCNKTAYQEVFKPENISLRNK